MNFLVEKGADIYSTNYKGVNVLHLAILKNYIPIARSLIKSGFELSLTTENGMSALHLICLLNRKQILDILIDHLLNSEFKRKYIGSVLN